MSMNIVIDIQVHSLDQKHIGITLTDLSVSLKLKTKKLFLKAFNDCGGIVLPNLETYCRVFLQDNKVTDFEPVKKRRTSAVTTSTNGTIVSSSTDRLSISSIKSDSPASCSLNSENDKILQRMQSDLQEVCCICTDTIKLPFVLSCTHMFCSSCIIHWFDVNTKQDCPKCKTCVLLKDSAVIISDPRATETVDYSVPANSFKEFVREVVDQKNQTTVIFMRDSLEETSLSKWLILHHLKYTIYTHDTSVNECCNSNILLINGSSPYLKSQHSFKNYDIAILCPSINKACNNVERHYLPLFYDYNRIRKLKILRLQDS